MSQKVNEVPVPIPLRIVLALLLITQSGSSIPVNAIGFYSFPSWMTLSAIATVLFWVVHGPRVWRPTVTGVARSRPSAGASLEDSIAQTALGPQSIYRSFAYLGLVIIASALFMVWYGATHP